MENSHQYNKNGNNDSVLSCERHIDNAGSLLLHEIVTLSDDELLHASQIFGDNYLNLLKGKMDSEVQGILGSKILIEMAPLSARLEGLDEKRVAKEMIEGYRRALDNLYIKHSQKPPFSGENLDDDAASHVKRVIFGPFGIPIVYTDGHNEELLGTDTLSFAASEVMIESGLPPLVVVYDGYNDREKQQVTTHETSHAVYALLIRAGVIPFAEGENVTKAGQKSAFDLARDEAIAQMAAGQNGAAHPDVVNRMRHEKIDENIIAEYGYSINCFKKSDAEKSGMQFSDAILGVMMARSFSDLNTHILRMANVSRERMIESDHLNDSSPVSSNGGWGSV